MSSDYSDIGFDPNLNAIGGLASNYEYNSVGSVVPKNQGNQDISDPLIFENVVERGAVTTTKIADASITNAKIGTAAIGTANIGTLSFNEIAGGTATLGGTTNGSGVLVVNNQSGSQVVKLDSSGIAVTNGSITIQNSSGSNVIDSSGLVGANVFLGSTVTYSLGTSTGVGNDTTAWTNWTDVSGMTINIILQRTTPVYLFFNGNFYMTGNASSSNHIGQTTCLLGGTQVVPASYWDTGNVANGVARTRETSLSNIYSIPAGTTIFKTQFRAYNGTFSLAGTTWMENSPSAVIGYIILGQ